VLSPPVASDHPIAVTWTIVIGATFGMRPASVRGPSGAVAPMARQPGLVTLAALAVAAPCPVANSGKPEVQPAAARSAHRDDQRGDLLRRGVRQAEDRQIDLSRQFVLGIDVLARLRRQAEKRDPEQIPRAAREFAGRSFQLRRR